MNTEDSNCSENSNRSGDQVTVTNSHLFSSFNFFLALEEEICEKVKQQIETLGGKVLKTFSNSLTHLVIDQTKSNSKWNSFFLKAKAKNIIIVSSQYIECCSTQKRRVGEDSFEKIQEEIRTPNEKISKRLTSKLIVDDEIEGEDEIESSINSTSRNAFMFQQSTLNGSSNELTPQSIQSNHIIQVDCKELNTSSARKPSNSPLFLSSIRSPMETASEISEMSSVSPNDIKQHPLYLEPSPIFKVNNSSITFPISTLAAHSPSNLSGSETEDDSIKTNIKKSIKLPLRFDESDEDHTFDANIHAKKDSSLNSETEDESALTQLKTNLTPQNKILDISVNSIQNPQDDSQDDIESTQIKLISTPKRFQSILPNPEEQEEIQTNKTDSMNSIHNHLPSPMSFASTPNNNFSFQEEQEEDECIPTQMKTFSSPQLTKQDTSFSRSKKRKLDEQSQSSPRPLDIISSCKKKLKLFHLEKENIPNQVNVTTTNVKTPNIVLSQEETQEKTEEKRDYFNTSQSFAKRTRKNNNFSQSIMEKSDQINFPTTIKKLVFSGLHSEERKLVDECLSELSGWEFLEKMDPTITHVILGKEQRRTIKVLEGIARGKWILSFEWILASHKQKYFVDETNFEVLEKFPGCRNSRLAEKRLFEGMKVYVDSKLENSPSPTEIKSILKASGAIICKTKGHCDIWITTNNSHISSESKKMLITKPEWIFDCLQYFNFKNNKDSYI